MDKTQWAQWEDLFKIVLFFGMPFIIILSIAYWLNPTTFWQKFKQEMVKGET